MLWPTSKNHFFFCFVLAALGLRCYGRAFSSCSEQALLFIAVPRASHYSGFSCCRAWALGARASVVVARRLISCGSWALEHRLSSCGALALLLRGMWDIPRPGVEPISQAMAGGFLTTVPPGKSPISFFHHLTQILHQVQSTANVWLLLPR